MASTKLKLLYLIDILRELTDDEHRLSVPELVEELGERGVIAERKSIYRDLDSLIEYGYDIVKSPSGYYLGRREFEIWELRLLSSAVSAATFITKARSDALIKKLGGFISGYMSSEILASSISGVKCRNDEVYRTIEAINAAIAERRQITFSYFKRDVNKRSVAQRSGQRYRVSPYAMIWSQDRYYLVCNVQEHDALTHFRLDRIKGVRMDPQPARPFSEVSEYTAVFDTSDYAKKCVNMFGGHAVRVTLRCSNRLVDEILDRFGEDTPIVRDGDGFLCTVSVSTEGGGFFGWAAQYGGLIEIAAPPEARAKMKAHLEDALSRY